MFWGSTGVDEAKTVEVAKDRETKMAMSSVALAKGMVHENPARRTRAFLNELGYERLDLVIRTDQEPAIVDLAKGISSLRPPRLP